MALSFFKWSRTASSNATADPNVNWAEGQAPSSINDSARAMMASAAGFRDDISGAIATGGTSTAYTVTSYQVFDSLANMDGKMIAFTPNATSTNAVAVDVTLNVDSLGAKPIRMQPGVTLPTGTLILGTPYLVVYNNSDGVFYLHNMANPYVIPISAGFDYWGPTTPNSCFAFPAGQAISRTTYASLFSGNPWSIGTTYGSGDGSTTFNLPDKTERVSVMKSSVATRLTSSYFGGNSTTLGATGGGESDTLASGNMPQQSVSVSGTVTVTATSGPYQLDTAGSIAVASGGAGTCPVSNSGTPQSSGGATLTGTIGNASPTPIRTVQPTIVCNYIIRVI